MSFTISAWPRTKIAIFALMLLGLALRLWFLSVNVIDPRFSAADDGDYYQRALRLAITGQYLDDSWLIRPPLHVFVFAGLLRISILLGQPDLGIPFIRALHVGLSLLTIPIGYDLARRLFNRGTGLVFAAILAIWFPLVELPALILTEPLFLFLLLSHLWLLVRWRDAYAQSRRRAWLWLATAGIALGLCALTRSQALYTTAFVLLFVLVTVYQRYRASNPGQGLGAVLRGLTFAVGRWSAVFLTAFVLVIAPWTLRNYLVYQSFIAIDTLGPVNLWLSLQPQRIDGGKSVLASIPQAERQTFVSTEIARIVRENPSRLVHNFWPHFRHVWKAQFIEDFLVKPSFYTRPLREVAALGFLGDAIWLGFVLGSLVSLTAPLREGAFRLVALAWMGYVLLTVMLLHVEPRYLLPIWLFMALYGAKTLYDLGRWLIQWRTDRRSAITNLQSKLRAWHGVLAVLLVVGFLYLFFSYRDYPTLIARGIVREQHYAAGARAYANGDVATAVREFENVVAVQPNFIEGRSALALAHLVQNQYDVAWAALGTRHTHRVDVLRGAITRAQGKDDLSVAYFTDAEARSGEDIQDLTMHWLRPNPTQSLELGNGLDFGYLRGFSFGESLALPDGSIRTYRWLAGDGWISLPLTEPLQTGSTVSLWMAGGQAGDTTLRLEFANGWSTTITVAGGQWRTYRLIIPADLAGQQRLGLSLDAPIFIPALESPDSADARSLSVMISRVEVQ
jgi:4-amino-4-deoxy-L-arabinose transferase-like glycosyltransferase